MRTLIAMLMLAASVASAHAVEIPEFKTMSSYALECEHGAGGHRVVLEVIPAESIVKFRGSSGKVASIPIKDAAVQVDRSYNRFGNTIMVAWPVWVKFEDSNGTIGLITNNSGGYVSDYIVRAKNLEHLYRCIPFAGSL
jgi:hypothetical protein